MRLHNRKSFMTSLPDNNPAPRRGPNLTHRLYLLIVLSLVAYLGYLIYERVFFLEAWGQVEVAKVVVSSSRGGRLDSLSVKEGQAVDQGTLLGRIAAAEECDPEVPSRLRELRMQTQLTQSRAHRLQGTLQDKQEKVEEFSTLRRALEINNATSGQLRKLNEDIQELQRDLSQARQTLRIEREQSQALETDWTNRPPPPECSPEALRAPRDATVLHVAHQQDEVVTRAQPIVTLVPDDSPVRIEAYLDEDELDEVHVGKHMTIEFPDGYQSVGRIDAIRSSAYQAARRTKQNYVPVSTRVRLDIVPETAKARERWQMYDRMDVSVRAGP